MENRSAPPKKTLWQRLKNMGPAAIVSAALIGPGTVTTSGLTGCNFGFALVWAVLFSVIAMVITQRMTGKIGLHTGIGLAAAIRKVLSRQSGLLAAGRPADPLFLREQLRVSDQQHRGRRVRRGGPVRRAPRAVLHHHFRRGAGAGPQREHQVYQQCADGRGVFDGSALPCHSHRRKARYRRES